MTQPALYTLAFALYAGGMILGLSVGWLARGKKERGRVPGILLPALRR